MKRRILVVLCLILLLALVGCDEDSVDNGQTHTETTPDYIGLWRVSDYLYFPYEMEIDNNSVTISSGAGESLEYRYVVSRDNYYTYLECISNDRCDAVIVFVNRDMLFLCWTLDSGNADPSPNIICTSGNGIEFDAEVQPLSAGVWVRSGSHIEEWPLAISKESALKETAAYDHFIYHKNSGILHFCNSQASQFMACYVENEMKLVYCESLSLVNAPYLPADSIYTLHNFVITDSK